MFLIFLVMVFLFHFLMSVFLLYMTKELILRDIINDKSLQLDKLREKIDNELKKMNEIVTRILTDDELKWVGNLRGLRENSLDLWEYFEYYKHFKDIGMINGELKPIIVLFLREGEIVYFASEEFGSFFTFGFENFCNYFSPDRMNCRVWLNKIFDKNNSKCKNKLISQEYSISGQRILALHETYYFPFDNIGNQLAILLVIIDVAKFCKLLKENKLNSQDSIILIYDRCEKKILTSNKADINNTINNILEKLSKNKKYISNLYNVITIRNKKYIFLRLASNVYDWDYVYLVPYNSIKSEIYISRTVYTLYLTEFTLFIIIISLYAIYIKLYKVRTYKITKGLKNVNEENENKILTFRCINKLKEKDRRLIHTKITSYRILNKITSKQELLNDMIIEKLIYGWSYSKGAIEEKIQSIGLKIGGKKFLVAIIKMLSLTKQVRTRDIIKNELESIRVDSKINLVFYYVYQLADSDLALILAFDEDEDEKVSQNVNLWLRLIGDRLVIKICHKYLIAVGRIVNNIDECRISFLDAKEIIEANKLITTENVENGILWYYNVVKKDNNIWYPIEIEERLMLLVNLGKISEIEEILHLLYYKNFEEKDISLSLKYVLISELIGTIIKIANMTKVNIDNLFDIKNFIFIEENDFDRLFEDIKQVFINITEQIKRNRKASKEKLIEEILEFINKNLFNPNMSISLVAERFNLSESYFSNIFKNAVGIKFSDYVEKLRIEEAYKLIKQKKWNLDDISKMVGYTNIKTFRRAFKRVKGCLPSEILNINEHDI